MDELLEPLAEPQVWSRNEGLAWQIMGTEAILLDMDRNMLRGINRSGWLIWELIDGKSSLGEISSQFASRYQLDAHRALSEVLAFVVLLRDRQLVRRAA